MSLLTSLLTNTNPSYLKRLEELEAKNETKQLFEAISGATSGTITTYTNITISQDNWANENNAFACETTTGRPNQRTLFTAARVPITAGILANGSYALSGTPTATNYCICWLVSGKQVDFANASIPETKIIQEYDYDSPFVKDLVNNDILPEVIGDNLNMKTGGFKDFFVTTAIKLGDEFNTAFNTVNKTIVGSLNEVLAFFTNILTITKGPTGFEDPKDVIITGNGTTRTVTLTGTVNAYYNGVLNTDLISGYTSPAHNDDKIPYFLVYDGTTIQWVAVGSQNFYDILIAISFYTPTVGEVIGNPPVPAQRVYQRECHGLSMPYATHKELHEVVGTYKETGGGLTNYVLSSTTAADRRPDIESSVIYDEDLETTNPLLLSSSLYTQILLTGTGLVNFVFDQADYVPLSGSRPYWNEFNGTNWVQTLMNNNYYASDWLMAVPMASDTNSQKLRYNVVQGQNQTASLAGQQGLFPTDLVLGNFEDLTPEVIFIQQIIKKYQGGNWSIVEVRSLGGTKISQSSSPAGNYLTTVSSDATLTGSGTVTDPLTVVQSYVDLTTNQSVAGIKTFEEINIDNINIDGDDIADNSVNPLGITKTDSDFGSPNNIARFQHKIDSPNPPFAGIGSAISLETENSNNAIVPEAALIQMILTSVVPLSETSKLNIFLINSGIPTLPFILTSTLLTVPNLSAGNITGTLLTAAQSNVTSLGTLTSLKVDNLELDGDTIKNSVNAITTEKEDAATTTASEVSVLKHSLSSGVGGTGIGLAQSFKSPNNAGIDKNLLQFSTNMTNVTNGSENSYTDIKTIKGGSEIIPIVIDRNYVLKPLQPYFNAYKDFRSNGVVTSTSYTVIFNNEITDINSDYNNTTGIFTAPIAGVYSFTFTLHFTGIDSTNTVGYFKFITTGFTYPGDYENWYANMNTVTSLSRTFAREVYMSAGDTAYVSAIVNGTNAVDIYGDNTGAFTSFTGRLVQ